MKILALTLCLLITLCGYSQQYDSWQKRDTTQKQTQRKALQDSLPGNSEMKITPVKPNTPAQQPPLRTIEPTINTIESVELFTPFSELIPYKKKGFKQGKNQNPPARSRFKGHWTGFYYGFVNASGTPDFMDLDWAGSFNMQFNFVKHSINLSPRNNMGLVVGLGFDYQRMKFADKNLTVTTEQGHLVPVSLEALGIGNVKRSTFKTLYLSIPLLYEVQFPARYKKNLYVSAGFVGGIRMHSKTKVVYRDHGKHKRKEKDSFNMIPFKADVTGRIGYRGLNVWGSYTLTNMFKGGHGPEIHPYTVGIGFTF